MNEQIQDHSIGSKSGSNKKQLVVTRQVLAGMSIAFKNFSLYPASHSICLQSLRTLGTRLQSYLDTYSALRLEVDDRALSWDEEEVHRDSDEKFQLAALLYRDGVKWLEFKEGIDTDEISKFMIVLQMNRVQQEETVGDIVTALWELNLPHLDYEAVDFISDGGEITDPINLKSVPDDATLHLGDAAIGGAGGGKESGIADYEKISVSLRQRYDLEFSATEKETLKQMVKEEEEKNIGQEALDILLIILDEQDEEGDFKDILSFIKEEFLFDLSVGEFTGMCNLLTKLVKYQIKCGQEKPWAVKLIRKFFQEISTSETTDVLSEVLFRYDDPNLKDSLLNLSKLLQLMSPAVIPALAQLLTKGYSELVELSLLTAIRSLAKRDITSLGKLFADGEALVVMKLLPILGSLKEEGTDDFLYNLIDHQDEQVRVRVLEKLLKQGGKLKGTHYKLIDDPAPAIRQLALNLLSSGRSELVESFLLKYLENRQYTIEDDNHILACYRALGSCGSGRSVSYLVKTLNEGSWKSLLGMGKTVHRHAAARALLLLDNPAAKKVLQDGAASKNASVREACNMVLGKNK